jgi:hypothetical protein
MLYLTLHIFKVTFVRAQYFQLVCTYTTTQSSVIYMFTVHIIDPLNELKWPHANPILQLA